MASPSERFSVYVIELNKDVLRHRKFKDANPGYDPSRACLYVGMTARAPVMWSGKDEAFGAECV